MRIQHNIMAMNSYRNYNNNTSALSKNLEKLSSGYKINRAGDDAAGLAISEKMRGQITGLDAAQKNVKDGISLVKTAEGAMQEVQDMLKRMKYLATQSANGTYQNDVDRENLQMEVDQLKEEIDRIGTNANFNGIYMLDGTYDAGKVKLKSGSSSGGDDAAAMEATATQTALDGLNAASGTSAFASAGVTIGGLTDAITKVSINTGAQEGSDDGKATVTINNKGEMSITLTRAANTKAELTDAKVTAAIKKAITDSNDLTADQKKALENVEFEGLTDASKLKTTAGTAVDITPKASEAAKQADESATKKAAYEATIEKADGKNATALADTKKVTINGKEYTIANTNIKYNNANIQDGGTDVTATTLDAQMAAIVKHYNANANDKNYEVGYEDGKLTFTKKDGADEDAAAPTFTTDDTNYVASTPEAVEEEGGTTGNGKGLTLQIGDSSTEILTMSIGTINQTALGITGVDISTPAGATAAIDAIKDATNYVSSVRGLLGAYQNRLEHTANNLSTMAENIQDAESTIRDTDVADEMMSYVKNNILVQSAQAMLAQANQVPQGVLQLLG
ncbi:MAG: flagellin [Oscillibacter sp.]|nr:flagellin [Oscillibacter sp.]